MQAGVVCNTVTAAQQFFLNEFEIIKLSSNSAPEYQYNLKDHLGNVRMTFTTKEEQDTFTANYEIGSQPAEATVFQNYSHNNFDIFDHTDSAGAVYTYSQLLNGGNNSQIGLAKSFSVMPGDIISAEVYAKYHTIPSAPNGNLTAFASALTGAFGLNGAMTGDPAQAFDALDTYGAAIAGGLVHEQEALGVT